MDHAGHDMGGHGGHGGHGNMDHADHGRADMGLGDLGHDDMPMPNTTPMSGHGSHGMGSMAMWFEAVTSGTVLFKPWQFDTVGGLLASMVGIFFMAALYEGLKYYREYLFWKTYNSLQYRAVTIPDKVESDENQIVQVVGEVIHKQPPTMWSTMHFFQTFLHMVQMILSYFLMLIFMTYNVYLCIAVVLGAGVGYFLFGWKKSVIVDVTEHCH